MNKSSHTPCIRNCCLDETDICLGCGRTLAEILDWSKASVAEKQKILQRSEHRKAITSKKYPGDTL